MSTATISQSRAAALSRLTAGGIIRSEWIKLRTVRSTVWAYAVTVLASLGLSALLGSSFNSSYGPENLTAEAQTALGLQAATMGLNFAQLSVAVLGVLVVSGEYSTGMIKSTLTAAPRRLPVLWAKAAVFGVVTFVIALVTTFASYFLSAPLMAANGVATSITDPGLAAGLVGGAAFLALIGVMSLGIGMIVRSGAAGIALAVGLLLIAPVVTSIIPAEWAQEIGRYLPTNAGQSLYVISSVGGTGFEPWQALLIMAGWAAAALAGGAVLLARRDA